MTIKTEEVRKFLVKHALHPCYFEESTPTSLSAAAAVGCSVAEIAKSVLLLIGEQPLVVITSGDMRVKSGPLKRASGLQGRMRLPAPEQVEVFTGYPPGSVSPFLLPEDLPVFLDLSLQRFPKVYPSAGSDCSAVAFMTASLPFLCQGRWVEVCEAIESRNNNL